MSSEEKLLKLLEDPKVQNSLAAIVEKIDVMKDLVETLWEFKRSGVLDDLLNAAANPPFHHGGAVVPRVHGEHRQDTKRGVARRR